MLLACPIALWQNSERLSFPSTRTRAGNHLLWEKRNKAHFHDVYGANSPLVKALERVTLEVSASFVLALSWANDVEC